MSKSPRTSVMSGSPTAATSSAWPFADPSGEYLVDAMQRTILFWDVLRRRSNDYYEHKAMAVPHVLRFDAEVVLDGRTFERPANYLLARSRRLGSLSTPRSGRSWSSIRAQGTVQALVDSKPTASWAWPCAPAIRATSSASR